MAAAMASAAVRFLAVVLGSVGGWSAAAAAEPGLRAPPSRPAPAAAPVIVAPLAIKKIGGLDYVSAADAARRLDLKLTTVERGRKITLAGPAILAVLENDSREATVNGLRVFLGAPVMDAGGQLFVSRIDFERSLTPLLRPGSGAPAPARPTLIALDPGHGGVDTGTSSKEKVHALDVAQRAQKVLESAGFRVLLTRDRDKYVDLAQRPAIANAHHADVFVSIHFNALARDSKTSGVEMFTFAPQAQRSAEAWSPAKKNDTENVESPGNRFDHWNMVLAQAIHRRFVMDLKTFDRGKKFAHWGVLRTLNCPGVLVECGFLTSEMEARKISTPAYRQQLAEAIAAGIGDYAATVGRARPKS